MDAVAALEPEFCAVRPDPVSAPVQRAGDRFGVGLDEVLEVLADRNAQLASASADLIEQCFSGDDVFALIAAPRTELAAPVPGLEVGVTLFSGRVAR